MKTQMKIMLALGVLCAGSATWFALSPSVPLNPATAAERAIPSALAERPGAESDDEVQQPSPLGTPGTEEPLGSGPASIHAWQALYAARLRASGDAEEARAFLIAELDAKYSDWIRGRLAELAKVEPQDRYESLAQMESRIQAVSESILGHLGIEGAQHLGVLAKSLEAIAAETEYAEMPGTHETRVAMFRLNREREARLEQLFASNESDAEEKSAAEVTPWYEARLREILGGDEPD